MDSSHYSNFKKLFTNVNTSKKAYYLCILSVRTYHDDLVVSSFVSHIASRTEKLEEPRFAHCFLTGENHRWILQMPVKEIYGLRTDELYKSSYY